MSEQRSLASCPSVSLSIQNTSAPTGRILTKLDIWDFLKNLSRKFKIYQDPTRITGTLCEDFSHLWQYLADFFIEWEMFQTKFVEEIKTRILC
jgi:hypothetical protein